MYQETQEKLYNHLEPILIEKIEAKHEAVEQTIEDSLDAFDDHEEVIKEGLKREALWNKYVQIRSLFGDTKEDRTQMGHLLTGSFFPGNTPDEEFKADFDRRTNWIKRNVKQELAQKAAGWFWIGPARTRMRNELKARLAMQPMDKFEDLVAKIISEINIDEICKD